MMQALDLWVQLSTPPARSEDGVSDSEKVRHKYENQQDINVADPS